MATGIRRPTREGVGTYDVENRVTAIGTRLTCGYRADNLRAWKQGSTGGKTYFLYDGGTPIIEMDGSGNVANINVFAPDGLVARKEGSTWTYYTFDQQGNVAQRLNSSQVVQTSRVFDAWGDGAETTTPRSYDCWNYNGKWGYYYDRETGLYYCQNRMYDSTTGRWINRDPIGYAGGINLYGYCGGGPVSWADPTGAARVKVISYRVFGPGWHRGIIVEDNCKGKSAPYSFAGGPERYGATNNGNLISRSGPWKGSQDEREYRRNKSADGDDDIVVLTLIDDCSSYDTWVNLFKGIEREIQSHNPKPYEPLPGDGTTRLSLGPFGPGISPHIPSANSNTWFMYLIREAGLQEPYDRAGRKIGGLPNAPGDTIKLPYQE